MKRIIELLAEWFGLIKKWEKVGREDVLAEIAVIDRKVAGECIDRNLTLTSACAIQRLKWVLNEKGNWKEIVDTIEKEEAKNKTAKTYINFKK